MTTQPENQKLRKRDEALPGNTSHKKEVLLQNYEFFQRTNI
jgi:hypothetical protein